MNFAHELRGGLLALGRFSLQKVTLKSMPVLLKIPLPEILIQDLATLLTIIDFRHFSLSASGAQDR